MEMLISVLFPVVTYLFYNYHMFRYASKAFRSDVPLWKTQGFTYVFNFFTFIVISHVGIHLIYNWIIFTVILCIEVHIIYRVSIASSLYGGLQGGLIGLAVNLITRSIAAIVMDQPLYVFDSIYHTASMLDNYKWIPISVGFFISGFIFWGMEKWIFRSNKEGYRIGAANLGFANQLMMALFVYLALNLLIFTREDNMLIIKVWGLKSGICALTGYFIGMHYIEALNLLKRFEIRSRQVRGELQLHQGKTQELSEIAYMDSLTGCYNQKFGMMELERCIEEKREFCFCFADLNGLKKVNDTLGHSVGDKYLVAAAHALGDALYSEKDMLCRYGGDEFILIFSQRGMETVTQVMENVQKELAELSGSSEYPFSMEISYGIVSGADYHDARQIIREADQLMYRHKSILKSRR